MSAQPPPTEPGATPGATPAVPVVTSPAAVMAQPFDVYQEGVNLSQVLTPEQIELYKQNTLTSFPVWAALVLHIVTLSVFTTIYRGIQFGKLPLVKPNDFGPGKAIGFMFIPYFNIYWVFRFWISFTDRINFQYRVRGHAPPMNKTISILAAVPLLNIIFAAVATTMLQGHINRLAEGEV